MSSSTVGIDFCLSEIPVLTGRANYHEWSLKIKAAARFINVWKAIQGLDLDPTDEANPETKERPEDRAARETRQEKAKGLLLCTVSFHLQVELDKLRPNPDAPDTEATAEQLWRHLEEKFAKNDIRAALLNYEKLIRTTITDDDTIEDQLNGLQTLHWKCSLDGFGFLDWQFAALILGLLPPSYKPVMYHFLENSPPLLPQLHRRLRLHCGVQKPQTGGTSCHCSH